MVWNAAQMAIEQRGECLNLGIAVGSGMNVRAIPVIGLALLKQDSVLSAYKLILRYQKLIGDSTNAQLIKQQVGPQERQALLRFHFVSSTGAIGTLSYEAAMAFCVKIARSVAAKQWRPPPGCACSAANPVRSLSNTLTVPLAMARPIMKYIFRPMTKLHIQSCNKA